MCRRIMKNPQAIIGFLLILAVILAAVFAPVLAPHDPEVTDLTKKFAAPCEEYPLGADELGRCEFSRLLYGARYSLGISLPVLLLLAFLGLGLPPEMAEWGAMDPSSTVSNIGSMADPVLGQLTGFGGITPELMAELDTTASNERVQEIYETILKSIADEVLLIPLVYKNETSVWNADVIADYTYYYDPGYTLVQNIRLK